MVVKDEVENR